MKFLKQLAIILAISFLGELCRYLIPLPIPASIYGMVLLFVALMTKLIRLDQVKETGTYLVSIMPVLFVCPAVGLIKYWDVVSEHLAAVLIIIVVSLILTFAVSGKVTEAFLSKKEGETDADQ